MGTKLPVKLSTLLNRLRKVKKHPFSSMSQKKIGMTAPKDHSNDYEHFFRYTSGRWLVDEPAQMAKRYTKFNVQALQHIASCALRSSCVDVAKLPEGLYNKVLSLRMENGKEAIAKIPNPNAGHSYYVVASEVATLDFLRNILQIPVPQVIEWSSRGRSSSLNPVGAEYILMERIPGRRLSDVWPTMSEAERFGLVKNMVGIEAKLTAFNMSKYGSVYYRDNCPSGLSDEQSNILTSADGIDASRFIIGPSVERQFWADERSNLNVDRGPWNSPEEYFSAIAKCEIAWLKEFRLSKSQSIPLLSETNLASPEIHVQLLEQFQRILPYILPSEKNIASSVLWHDDLHLDNIFVDDMDPTKISGIIDWQTVSAAPLFIQARFPSVFDCEGPYDWRMVMPTLPENYNSLSESNRQLASERHAQERLKKFYEIASRKFNPLLGEALDAMRDEDDPTAFIFHIFGRTSLDGPIPLRELLIQIFETWDGVAKNRGLNVPCPISFTKDQIREARAQAEEWAEAFNKFNSLRVELIGKDGWVSHEEYDEALARFNVSKQALGEHRKRLCQVSGATLQNLDIRDLSL